MTRVRVWIHGGDFEHFGNGFISLFGEVLENWA
jgi:hypothetical protein